MRPTPVWYHELKNRMFWWLGTKNCRIFLLREKPYLMLQRSFTSCHISRNTSSCRLWLNNRKLWIHSSVAQALLVTAPPHFQKQMKSNHSAVPKMPCTFQCSIHKLLCSYFLPCFWTWDQSPCQQFRIKGEIKISLYCMTSVKLPCFLILCEVQTHVTCVAEE